MWKVPTFLRLTGSKVYLLFSLLICLYCEISEGSHCAHCEIARKVLEYYTPDYDVNEDVGICDDPCVVNNKIIDPKRIQAIQDEPYNCNPLQSTMSCAFAKESKYRTIDGSCNNVEHPTWGMANICYRTFLPHDYGDGVSRPRKSCTGSELPNVRLVSTNMHKRTDKIPKGAHTFTFMEFGQIVAHDISRNEEYSVPDDCQSFCTSKAEISDKCIAVKVPKNDPIFEGKKTCLPFVRTTPCNSTSGQLEAKNAFSGYFDLGLIYSNDEVLSIQLRTYVDGMLKMQYLPGVGTLPPPTEKSGKCKSLDGKRQCFFAADDRIAQNPLITTIHIALLRNHNNICSRLKLINPEWNDEKLYEEARRINIAQAQHITFSQYLPIVLGPRLTADFNLDVLPGTLRTKYDPRIDATVIDEVVVAAHRFGHTMVDNTVDLVDPITQTNDSLSIGDYYFYPFDYYNGLLESITCGMAKTLVWKRSNYYSFVVRDWLNHLRDDMAYGGSDLAATSLIRGRDHGHPGYAYYLKLLFQHDVRSFCDLRKFLPPEEILKMRKLYKSVYDVDMFSAGLTEHSIDGSLVGPTFAAMMLMQYYKIKFGDRYYYEHEGEAGSFTPRQLVEIKKTTLAGIICDTINIMSIQENVFYPPSEKNPTLPCERIPKMDLSAWAEV